VRKWAALAFSETRKLFIARHSNVANWVGSTWNTCDFGPKEILLPRQKAMNQCKVSLFVSHSTKHIILVCESIFLWSKSQVCCWSWLLEWLQSLVRIQFENVSSSYIRLLQCILHALSTLSLPSNRIIFLPKANSQCGREWACANFQLKFKCLNISDYWFISPSAFLSRCIPPLQGQMWNLRDGSVWEMIESLNQTMFR